VLAQLQRLNRNTLVRGGRRADVHYIYRSTELIQILERKNSLFARKGIASLGSLGRNTNDIDGNSVDPA